MGHGDAVKHSDIFPGLEFFVLVEHLSGEGECLSFVVEAEAEKWSGDELP